MTIQITVVKTALGNFAGIAHGSVTDGDILLEEPILLELIPMQVPGRIQGQAQLVYGWNGVRLHTDVLRIFTKEFALFFIDLEADNPIAKTYREAIGSKVRKPN